MTDKEILETFLNKKRAIKNQCANSNWLGKHKDIETYLLNRFNDIPKGQEKNFILILNRIKYKIEKWPKCKICQKEITYKYHEDLFRTYCSADCRNKDKELNKIKEESRKKTYKNKYNADSLSDINIVKEHKLQTLKLRYGKNINNPSQIEAVKKKKEQTYLEKYGVTNPLFSNDIKDKIRQTSEEKYGVNWPIQNIEIRRKSSKSLKEFIKENGIIGRRTRYIYKEMRFDSADELAFYIYHEDLGHKINREPKSIPYNFKNELHYYFPDFEIEGKLYEIKGSHFIDKETGWLINPFDKTQNDLYKAKHKCMIINNVELITDTSLFLNYIIGKYGKNYLSNFKN